MASVNLASCRSLEDRFLERFRRRLKEVRLIHSPLTNASYDTSEGVIRESSDELEAKAAVRRHAPPGDQAAMFEKMPRNAVVVMEFYQRRLFGGRKPRAAAAAAAVNPLEDLARDGKSDRRAGAREVASALNKIVTNPRVFYTILLFSPSGWDRAAREQTLGPNYVAALADPYGPGLRVFIPSNVGMISRKLFDLMAYPEKYRMLQALMERCAAELVQGDFTEDLAAERLHFPPEVTESLFEDAAAADPFLTLDNRRTPIRLLREYSRGGFPSRLPAASENELLLYRDAAARDNARIQRLLQDLEVLARREEEMLERGARSPERERRLLAHLLRRLRLKRQELESRLEVFQKRYRITTGYVLTLEQLRAVRIEAVPDPERLEKMMAQASVAREQIQEMAQLAEAGAPEPETPEDVAAILKELDASADEQLREAVEEDRSEAKTREEERGEEPLLES